MSEAADGRGIVQATRALALVTLLALGVCASTASADPLSMTFTEDRANVGVQLSDAPMFEPPATAPFSAQIDPTSGSITGGTLDVPQFATHITTPINADVTVDFTIGTIGGSFNQATGALTLEGTAGGTLTSEGEDFEGEECIVSTDPTVLVVSSSTPASVEGSPRSGAAFAHGLTGQGAIAGAWTDMHAAPVDSGDQENVDFCNNVEGRIGGPGGIWLYQQGDVVAPAAPQLSGTSPDSPNPSGTPRIRGAAETGSTVRVYANASCSGAPVASGSADELRSPGIRVEVAAGTTVDFSATATDPAGNSSDCSAPISYRRPKLCVVPDVIGKKLKAAKRRLRAAGCTVGRVHRPKRLKHRRRHRVLVVRSSNPAAGATAANGKVNLRLGPKR